MTSTVWPKAGIPLFSRRGGTDEICISEKVLLLSDSVAFLVHLSSAVSAKVLFPDHSRITMEFQFLAR